MEYILWLGLTACRVARYWLDSARIPKPGTSKSEHSATKRISPPWFWLQRLRSVNAAAETWSCFLDVCAADRRIPTAGENPARLVMRLSLRKAQAAGDKFPDALIIGSDQVACINDIVLGKPGDRKHAIEQLQTASGAG